MRTANVIDHDTQQTVQLVARLDAVERSAYQTRAQQKRDPGYVHLEKEVDDLMDMIENCIC